MRKIVAGTFVSLDGVMESPDKWHFPYFDDKMGEAVGSQMAEADAMLLGRVTYQEFASYWPQQTNETPGADFMNPVQKYVVSTTLKNVDEWQNSTLIDGTNFVAEIQRLKRSPGQADQCHRQRQAGAVAAAGEPARRAAAAGAPDRGRRREALAGGRHRPGAAETGGLPDLRHRRALPHLPAGRPVAADVEVRYEAENVYRNGVGQRDVACDIAGRGRADPDRSAI